MNLPVPVLCRTVTRTGAVAGTLLLLALAGCKVPPDPGPTRVAQPAVATSAPVKTPVVLVIGDSYSAGYDNVGMGADNWSQIMGREQGWRVDSVGTAGTGYVAVAWGSSFAHTAVTHPENADAVVVFGGLNDLTVPPDWELVDAETTFAAVRLAEPHAALVVVGPQWPGDDPDPRMFVLRDAVAKAAAEYGANFVDALGWSAGHPELLHTDAKHPSAAGHQYLAAMIGPYVTAALQH